MAPDEQGFAGGLIETSMQLGPALVLAIATAVNDANTRGDGSAQGVLDGFHAALVVPLIVAVIGAAVTAFGLRGRRPADPAPALHRTAVPEEVGR